MNSTTATIATVCAETAETMNRTALVMGKGIVELLASRYGFDAAEAFEAISFEVPSKKAAGGKKANATATEKQPKGDKVKKVKIPLPFVGIINAEWCMGIRTNQGLFTQCTNAKPKDGSEYCPTCAKQAETNATGKPTYGNINDRAEAFEAGIEWRDPKENKAVAHYANVAAKLNIDLEVAKAECLKVFGVAIPDDQLEVKATQRGRPKKDAGSAIVSDTDSTASGESKKRGRPKKVKTVIEGGAAGDDLIAGLVAAAQNGSDASSATPTKKAKAPKPELTEEEKAAKLKAAAEKRAATLAAKKAAQPPKPELSEEEKKAKRKEAAEKRKAAAAEKQAAIVLAVAQSLYAAEKQASSASDSEKPKTPVAPKPNAHTPKAKQVVVAKVPEPEPELEIEELDDEEEAEGEDVEVEKWACPVDGKTYLKSPDNVLYDLETQEPVGVWNEATQEIDEISADEDDDYC